MALLLLPFSLDCFDLDAFFGFVAVISCACAIRMAIIGYFLIISVQGFRVICSSTLYRMKDDLSYHLVNLKYLIFTVREVIQGGLLMKLKMT